MSRAPGMKQPDLLVFREGNMKSIVAKHILSLIANDHVVNEIFLGDDILLKRML